MVHFPSTLQQGSTSASKRSEGPALNATQQKPSAHSVFAKVEEELHDARRVHADGQEDDLRYALNMVINRVTELSSMLSEAYKAQAELELQLDVAKSNLKLVIANNEMLEDALKQNLSKDVGWNRTNRRSSGESKESRTNPLEHSQSTDIPSPSQAEPTGSPPTSSKIPQENRFFKFRFSSSAATSSRPITPSGPLSNSPNTSHLTSPSLPSLSSVRSKEIEMLTAELEKEKAGRKKIKEEKAALEAELEALSQALFEEANKMVADERRLRAEIEDELKELRIEKDAIHSALRLVASEDAMPELRSQEAVASADNPMPVEGLESTPSSRSRTSSQVGVKSRPQSLELALLSPLPASPHFEEFQVWRNDSTCKKTSFEGDDRDPLSVSSIVSQVVDSYSTSRFPPSASDDPFIGASPWTDAVSHSTLETEPIVGSH